MSHCDTSSQRTHAIFYNSDVRRITHRRALELELNIARQNGAVRQRDGGRVGHLVVGVLQRKNTR